MQPRLFLLHSNGLSLEDVQAERVWVMDYGLGGGCLDLGVPYTCRVPHMYQDPVVSVSVGGSKLFKSSA